MMSDGSTRVRSSALTMLSNSLKPMRRLPRSDANVFSEYILPVLNSVIIIFVFHVAVATSLLLNVL